MLDDISIWPINFAINHLGMQRAGRIIDSIY